jgi:A/G-specific adenine glycosylase
VAKGLIDWFLKHKRDLPWRQTNDPYCIWISEVILQQTRVNQGIDYYYRFIERFPNVSSLANADVEEVLKLWQGLGYYSRARNLHAASRQIINEFGGIFPKDVEKLRLLKGVGNYTSSAIASIAFEVAVPVVDGNVYRVIARFIADDTPIGSSKAYTLYYNVVKKMMGKSVPSLFNQALMELGALVCTVNNPDCNFCPLAISCKAFKNALTGVLPVKAKKVAVRKRYFYYVVMQSGKQLIMNKRHENDIWNSLFDFPLIETKEEKTYDNIVEMLRDSSFINFKTLTIEKISPIIKHKLTHQTIYVTFIRIKLEKITQKLVSKFQVWQIEKLSQLAVPKVIEKYLADEFDIKK